MNWLKRLLHLEEPEPVEKPEPKPPVLEPCPICGEKPTVQPDTESDIPQLVCSCNELLGNDGITNVYQRKHEWIRRCVALKRKQDNVSEMEQLIGETQ